MATAKGNTPAIKVLCLAPYNFLPAKMGGQKCINVLLTFMAKYVPLICVTIKNNNKGAAGYPVLNILSNSPLRYINIFYFFKFRKLLRQHSITHLQIEHPYYGWLAVLLKKICGVKLVLHSHNIEGKRFKSVGKWWGGLLLAYERWVHRTVDYLFYITEEDRNYAVKHFGIAPSKTLIVPYGVEQNAPPTTEEREQAKQILVDRYDLQGFETLLLLNGAFNYKPNLDALKFVIEELNPILAGIKGFTYRIIICGKDIPADILKNKYPNMHVAGFVDDIETYFIGSDIFLNPISGGGGIKTKLVEALGYDLSAVSFKDGAIGIPPAVVGDKLIAVADGDVAAFAGAINLLKSKKSHIPVSYFDFFNADIVGENAALFLSGSTT